MSLTMFFLALVLIVSCMKLIKGNMFEDPACISSSTGPYQVNTDESSLRGTLLEGRCFLHCLDRLKDQYTFNRDSIRPYPIINETADCLPDLVELHSCVEGCVIIYNDGDCLCNKKDYCSECDGCVISEANEDIWTSQAGCRVDCYSTNLCQTGCNFGIRLVNELDINQHRLHSSQPVFQKLNNSYETGLYSVSLTSTSLTQSNSLTAFLFQITDQQSGNVSYVWQNDWTKPLDLSGYACRTVNVSLTLVAESSDTVFEPVEIHVEGVNKNEVLTNFTCTKEIAIYNKSSPPEAYFKFDLQWETLLHSDLIKKIVIDYKIYDSIKNITTNTNEPTSYISNNSFSTNYTNFSLPRTKPEELFLFELRILWKNGKIQDLPYTCTLSGQSPAPEAVQYFMISESNVTGHDEVQVSAQWSEPLVVNGVLAGYRLCLSRQPLEGNERPNTLDSFCLNVSSDAKSVDAKMKLNTTADVQYGYVQIQPLNAYETGQWSENVAVLLVKKSPHNRLVIGASVISGVITISLLIALASFYLLHRFHAHKKQIKCIEANTLPMNGIKTAQIIAPFQVSYHHSHAVDKWEVLCSDVTVDEMLGQGQFGTVMKGQLFQDSLSTNAAHYTPVAIKLLKSDNVTRNIKNRFLSEIEIMKKVSEGHNPHVVAMLGCVTTQEPLCLITELVEHGDLLSYLQSRRNNNCSTETSLTDDEVLNFSYQIADGMDYISSMGIVHRDLACRNILVGQDKVLKIADFGLSQESSSLEIANELRVPIKWMPLEYLEKSEFTSASDVWSFGVVLWEIATSGKTPYQGIRNKDFLSYLMEGHRLEKPENTSATMYEVMQSCWKKDPMERLTFGVLKQKFNDMLESNKQYLILHEVSNERTLQYITETNDTSTKLTLSCSELNSNLPRSVSLDMEWKSSHILEGLVNEAYFTSENRQGINHSKSLGVIHEVAQCRSSHKWDENRRLKHLSMNYEEPRYC